MTVPVSSSQICNPHVRSLCHGLQFGMQEPSILGRHDEVLAEQPEIGFSLAFTALRGASALP